MKRDFLLVGLLVTALAVVGADLWWGLSGSDSDDALEESSSTSIVTDDGARRRDPQDAESPSGGEAHAGLSKPEASGATSAAGSGELEFDAFGIAYATLEGRVQGPEGQVLAGAQLRLFLDQAPGARQSVRGERVLEFETNDQGFFSVSKIETHDTYVLEARHAGHQAQFAPNLKLSPGESRQIVLRLMAGLPFFGRVTDLSGQPLAAAEVTVFDLRNSARQFEDTVEATVQTDAEGNYFTENLAPGLKRVVARADGFGTATRPQVRLNRRSSEVSWDLKLGSGGSIEGRVVDASDRALARAEIKIKTAVPGPDRVRGHFEPLLTDEQGRFRATGLPEGATYTLQASKSGYRSTSLLRRRRSGANLARPEDRSAVNATVGDRGLRLVLERGSSLSGRVVDAKSGEPRPGFELVLSATKTLMARAGSNAQRFRSPDGRFEFSTPMLEDFKESVWLFALAPGYAGVAREITRAALDAADGRMETLELSLERGGSIRVRLVDAKGKPVPEARVTAFPKPEGLEGRGAIPFSVDQIGLAREGYSALSDAEGWAEVSELLPGNYRLRAQHSAFAPAFLDDRDIELVADETVEAGSMTLFRGARVMGSVVNGRGKALEGAEVYLRPAENPSDVRRTRTGITGRFDFRRLPPGAFTLFVAGVRGESTIQLGETGLFASDRTKKFLIADGETVEETLKVRR